MLHVERKNALMQTCKPNKKVGETPRKAIVRQKLFWAILVSLFSLISRGNADLLVTDPFDNLILKFDGILGGAPLDPPFAIEQSSPFGLASGPDHNVYVAVPQKNQVAIYNETATVRTTLSPPGSVGQISKPLAHITVDKSDNIFVTGLNNSVLRYDKVKASWSALKGGDLRSIPYGLTFGPDGRLYVANFDNGSILRYDEATKQFRVFIPSSQGQLLSPEDLTFGPNGFLYVAGAQRLANGSPLFSILAYDSAGLFQFAIKTPLAHNSTVGEQPYCLTVGPDKNIYVTTYIYQHVLRLNATTQKFDPNPFVELVNSNRTPRLFGIAFTGSPMKVCSYKVSATPLAVPPEGGEVEVQVSTGPQCWWVNPVSHRTNFGNGQFEFKIPEHKVEIVPLSGVNGPHVETWVIQVLGEHTNTEVKIKQGYKVRTNRPIEPDGR